MAKYIDSSKLISIINERPLYDVRDEALLLNIILEMGTQKNKDMWIIPQNINEGDIVRVNSDFFNGSNVINKNKIYFVESVDTSVIELGDTDYLIKLVGIDGFWYSEHFIRVGDNND